MIRTLTYGKHRKARIWVGELPKAIYSCSEVVEINHLASKKCAYENKSIAIELILPFGPRVMYGMLGAILVPNMNEFLKINLCLTDSKDQKFIDNLSSKYSNDVVYVGLPSEYRKPIVESLMLSLKMSSTIRSGNMKINCAAYGVSGSSPMIFKKYLIF